MTPIGLVRDSSKILFADGMTLGPVDVLSVTALSAASATASLFRTAISAVIAGSRRIGGPRRAGVLLLARLHRLLERVDQRLPRRRDDVLVHADGAPQVLAVGRVEQHARDRVGALGLVEDADLE